MHQAGYDCGGYACAACGEVDDLFHRLWECPATAEARRSAAPTWLVRQALCHARTNLSYTRGLIPHPGDLVAARPATSGHGFTSASTEELGDAKFEGLAYTDGSCSRSDIVELRPSAGALVLMDEAQPNIPRLVLAALVWAPLPQTAPAGEFVAAALAYQAATGPVPLKVYTDCEAVYRAHAGYPALPRTAVYAGIVRDRAAHPTSKHVLPLTHMRAHQSADSVAPELRNHVFGNAVADAAAKLAVARLHEQQADGVAKAAEAALALATLVLRVIGAQACL